MEPYFTVDDELLFIKHLNAVFMQFDAKFAKLQAFVRYVLNPSGFFRLLHIRYLILEYSLRILKYII